MLYERTHTHKEEAYNIFQMFYLRGGRAETGSMRRLFADKLDGARRYDAAQ